MGQKMKKRSGVVLFLVLLCASFGLAYGVSQASAGLARTNPVGDTARSTDRPTDPSASPSGTAEPSSPSPTVRPAAKPAKPTPAKPKLVPGPKLLGEGSSGPAVKDLQARLKQIAWYSPDIDGTFGSVTTEAVRGFQDKRRIPATGFVDQRTLDRLHAMTRVPTQDELNNIIAASANSNTRLDARCLTGRAICVDKTSQTLRWVVDGNVRTTFAVRFGSAYTPTREGQFQVNSKSANHVSSLYDTPMPYAMFFSGGQAVHYSSDFASRGYAGASHGCVNVRDLNGIRWLFSQVAVGDKVVVYRA